MRFAILTPVLDGEKFLDQSILSVVSQTGPFTIRYHVRDGGSKDRTLEILAGMEIPPRARFSGLLRRHRVFFRKRPRPGPLRSGQSRLCRLCLCRCRCRCNGVDRLRRPFRTGRLHDGRGDFQRLPGYRLGDRADDRSPRSWDDAVYAAADHSFSTKSHSRRYIRRPVRAHLDRTRSHVLAAAIMAKGRWVASIRISELPVISIFGGALQNTPTWHAIAPKSTHRFRPLKSKRATRPQRGMRGRGMSTVSSFATGGRGGVSVGRCASRRFSAPRPSKRNIGA